MCMAMHDWVMLLYTWNKHTLSTTLWVSSTPTQNTNYKKRMLTLFLWGFSNLGCCHIPEALGPLDGLSWGWGRLGGCASQWALPHGPGGPVPLCTGPQPPDPGGSSCSETTPTAPKGRGASGLEELLKAPWAPRLQVMGFPPPASFLRVTPPTMKAPSTAWCCRNRDVSRGWG